MSAPEESMHVCNPHVLFGTNWQQLTHDEQAKEVAARDVYRPLGPTHQAFSTPPPSPAMFSTPNTGSNMKTSGGIRASPHAAAVRAQMAAQQSEGRVSNAHLSFGLHTWPHQGSQAGSPMEEDEDEAPGINTARLDLRAAHQEQNGQ